MYQTWQQVHVARMLLPRVEQQDYLPEHITAESSRVLISFLWIKYRTTELMILVCRFIAPIMLVYRGPTTEIPGVYGS